MPLKGALVVNEALMDGNWDLVKISVDFPGGSNGKASASMQEIQVQSLGQEDPLEKEMATHSSTLAWKIPWMEKPGRKEEPGGL